MNVVIPNSFIGCLPSAYTQRPSGVKNNLEIQVGSQSLFVQKQLEIQKLQPGHLVQSQPKTLRNIFRNLSSTPVLNQQVSSPLCVQPTRAPQFAANTFCADAVAGQKFNRVKLLELLKEVGGTAEGSDARQILALESLRASTSDKEQIKTVAQGPYILQNMFAHSSRFHIDHTPQFTGGTPKYFQITEAVQSYYDTQRQSNVLYNKKLQLREALHVVIDEVFPYCGLYIVGSSVNGFGNNMSDMDLCLMVSQTRMVRQESAAVLKILEASLRNCKFLKDLQFINAKVPILKFTDSYSGVECDLNINSDVGVRNTYLLNAYSCADRRLDPLVLFVKHWARYHNINNAQLGSLSSYSLVLMVIHYLQVGAKPVVLPVLHHLYPERFSMRRDIRELTLTDNASDFTSSNQQSLGELFVGFLNYYSNVFNFDSQAISVRLGCAMPRHIVIRQNPVDNPVAQWKFICIEEPFNLTNTARAVYDRHKFMHIKHVMDASATRIKRTKSIDSILHEPL